MTPTPDHFDALRVDLQRAALHLETAASAHRRGLDGELVAALARATTLVDDLLDCARAWSEDAQRAAAVVGAVVGAADALQVALPPPADPPPLDPPPLALAAVGEDDDSDDLGEPEAPTSRKEGALHPCPVASCDRGFGTAQGLTMHRRRAHPEPVVARPMPPAPADVSPPPPDPPVSHGQWGRFDVKELRGRRFVRCPELLCGVRVDLDPEDATEADVAGALDAHRPSCNARPTAMKGGSR